MKGTIVYSGMELSLSFKQDYSCYYVRNIAEAVERNLLQSSDVVLIGPEIANPVKEVQNANAADKHISIIVLASPAKFSQTKQSFQFSPFLGKNAQLVSYNPELSIASICDTAISRTRQRRSFAKINLHEERVAATAPGVKISYFGSFLEHAPVAAILLDPANKVVSFNRQAKKTFPLLDRTHLDLAFIFSSARLDELNAFIHSGHDVEESKEIVVGQKVFELTSSEVYNEEGMKHFLLLFNDITDKQLEIQRVQSILEALPQMAWTTDENGKPAYFTHGWYHYTGQTKEEAMNDGWQKVVHEADINRLFELWQVAVSTGKPFQHAARYRNTKNEYRWHLVRATAVRNLSKEISMWVGTCTDIHDQVAIREELERKVKERTLSLEASNRELEQFAHVSSHDLQEPLRKIRTFASLLSDLAYDKLDESSRKYLKKINTTAERMSNLLKALLNYTRMQREEKFERVDLQEIFSHVLEDLELLIEQKHAVIHHDRLPVIRAASTQMHQLLYNLVNNALKFSRNNVPVEIEVRCSVMEAKEIEKFPSLQPFASYYRITVKDNGIGFQSEYAEKVFAIFQRLHKKTEYEGTGIGLSLVKRVVQNHKGEVYAESEPGKGSAFHIILPAA